MFFTNSWNTKKRKWRFSHICKIVKNIKKFSYTWFISPRIIYCLVPRQPLMAIWGGYRMGDPSRKVCTFRDVEIFAKFGLWHLHVHTIFHKFTFYKNYFYKIYFYFIFYKIIFYKNYFMLLLEFYKNKILPKDFIKIKNIFFIEMQ